MPTRNKSGKPEHSFQNPNKKRKKSGKRYKKAFAWYALLEKKRAQQWDTKWIEQTMKKVKARFKKFGITQPMVDAYMEKRSS